MRPNLQETHDFYLQQKQKKRKEKILVHNNYRSTDLLRNVWNSCLGMGCVEKEHIGVLLWRI